MSSVGSGPTVALLLHQTGRSASCGWWPYANHLAGSGVRAVLLDLCGYGPSTCDVNQPWSRDYPAQVTLAATRLRTDGAQRLTLVGASLGGTVASVSATPAKADAVVNLSGFGYAPMVTAPSLAALTIPVLGAGSRSEDVESAKLEKEIAASASPTKRFVWADAGHGWSLVLEGPKPDSPMTPIGRIVLGWVKGDYAAT
jgi:pimeloyl-ACP methyl ester carboxylesterase